MAFLCDLAHSFTTNAKQDKMFILTVMLYFTSKSYKIQVTKLATKQKILVTKEKKLVALATILVAISSPAKQKKRNCKNTNCYFNSLNTSL